MSSPFYPVSAFLLSVQHQPARPLPLQGHPLPSTTSQSVQRSSRRSHSTLQQCPGRGPYPHIKVLTSPREANQCHCVRACSLHHRPQLIRSPTLPLILSSIQGMSSQGKDLTLTGIQHVHKTPFLESLKAWQRALDWVQYLAIRWTNNTITETLLRVQCFTLPLLARVTP